jgi:hypothetical protein
MVQNMRQAAGCDVDHTKAYKVRDFQPDGMTLDVENVMGTTYLMITWSGTCPRCAARVRNTEPVRTSWSVLVAGDADMILKNVAGFLAR